MLGKIAVASRWVGRFFLGGALNDKPGAQTSVPGQALVDDVRAQGPDAALQISTVWACVDLISHIIASLPFFAYDSKRDGHKELARTSRLYSLLRDSPNSRMTPYEFWVTMILNLELRGNAYARLERDDNNGEVISMWPMAADQVHPFVLDDGEIVYSYRLQNDIAVLSSESVLHLKGMGNGTVGFSKLEFMRCTTDEVAKAQHTSGRMFGTNGKPTGVLMVDNILTKEQRAKVKENFAEMAMEGTGRLHVLEANMRYQQLTLSPEDQQLLETRRFHVEEICRWYGVPPVLVHHANVTSWGSGIEQIVDGFHKLKILPMLVNIEQSVRKRLMTPRQRAQMVAEFNHDALLRGNLKDRMDVYSKAVQNGLKTRNECRQLENDPPVEGGDDLTAQSNLLPLSMLGKVKVANVTN